ncbi:hypothetical protein I317_05461 [Kwoniella heveanensis CBS 569]|nr:hypothetical protein I317_05461 [Kwoniella heveanensis CBS 569]
MNDSHSHSHSTATPSASVTEKSHVDVDVDVESDRDTLNNHHATLPAYESLTKVPENSEQKGASHVAGGSSKVAEGQGVTKRHNGSGWRCPFAKLKNFPFCSESTRYSPDDTASEHRRKFWRRMRIRAALSGAGGGGGG